MKNVFPEAILNLPKADIAIDGLDAYLSQGDNHQILYMSFNKDFELSEHSHNEQWGVVLEGQIKLVINDIEKIYKKGDRYFIPKGVKHYGMIFAGYSDMTFFNQIDRYKVKNRMDL